MKRPHGPLETSEEKSESGEGALRRKVLELERCRDHLEALLGQRTKELAKTNADLEAELAERKRVEESLRQNEARFPATIENLPFDLWMLGSDGFYIMQNSTCKIRYGEIIGKRPEDVCPDNDTLQIWKNNHRRAFNGEVVEGEVRFVFDGDERFYRNIVCPVRDGNEIRGILGVNIDITESKQTERQLRQMNEYLENILADSPDGIGIVDRHGKLIKWNKMAAEQYGYTFEELEGKSVFDLYVDRNSLDSMLTKLRSDGAVNKYAIDMRRKNGTVASFELSISLLRDDANTVIGSVCVARDLSDIKKLMIELKASHEWLYKEIAERKRAEEARARLTTAIEQSAEAIFITDADWIIDYVNPAFERLSGYDRSELSGQHICILQSDKVDKSIYQEVRATLIRGQVWSGHLINKKKDGTFYEAAARASAVRDKWGAIINYVGIHRDATNEMRLERELRQSQKMEAIGTLAGGIAHDFNNILTAIIGFSEIALYKVPKGSPLYSNLGQILKAGIRAKDLVKQILTASRKSEQECKPIQVAPVVKEALKFLRSSLPSTIEIRQSIEMKPLEGVILSEPIQIHQLLMNLCSNAAHAMRIKGGILSVSLSVVEADAELIVECPDIQPGSYVKLTVSDTGCGMDAALIDRIFDPYFTTKGPGEGTGMGLSVVQGIVRGCGGALTVSSEPDVGTTFHIYFPTLQGNIPSEIEAVEGPATGAERILFVDDEKALAELGKEMLETLGYNVTAKTSGLDALEAFRAQPGAFDLVITDMTMPGFTGRELAEKILQIRADIPIILSTGFSALINEEQAKEAGIREFINKPYVITALAKTIREVLDNR
ncbi:MAG: PAS domain S-box protein [Syntrophobacteraceae bacterium]|jgi:PAS domain S-box-containing protein